MVVCLTACLFVWIGRWLAWLVCFALVSICLRAGMDATSFLCFGVLVSGSEYHFSKEFHFQSKTKLKFTHTPFKTILKSLLQKMTLNPNISVFQKSPNISIDKTNFEKSLEHFQIISDSIHKIKFNLIHLMFPKV